MKVIELQNPNVPSFQDLLEAAQQENIVLMRNGHPLALLEKLEEKDWQDMQYESSPEALERGRIAREQFARGEYKTLKQVREELGN
jgi:PHD/YefM family antitoxin component YafN of YafNO toxin-antitoxin module